MSRIGKQPVTLPSGVTASINGRMVSMEGPKGKLEYKIAPFISVADEGGNLVVSVSSKSKQSKADYGTTRSQLNNMVQGVSNGWKKSLLLSGVGFVAKLNGKILTLSTGYSHTTDIEIPEKVNCQVDKVTINLDSIDKQMVGLIAAKIRAVCPPEPYLGKGIKYSGENVRRKAGKTGG